MTDQELEELLNMTVPSDKDVEAAGKRFDRRLIIKIYLVVKE